MKLISFDIGLLNSSYSVFSYEDYDIDYVIINKIKLCDKISRDLLDDIINSNNISLDDNILIEEQRNITYAKRMSYIKGFFEGRKFKSAFI